MKKQFCTKGHDILIVGRDKNRACKECKREYARDKNKTIKHKKRFCINGHDTKICGRNRHSHCKQCIIEKGRKDPKRDSRRTRFCPKKHNKDIVGRTKTGGCKKCSKDRYVPHPRQPKQFCPRGHDTWICGRDAQSKCMECGRIHSREWSKNHPEKVNMRARRWRRQRTKKQIRKQKITKNIWRAKHPDIVLAIDRNRNWKRLGILNVDGSFFRMENYLEVCKIQDNRCKVCNKHRDELGRDLYAEHNHKTGEFRGLVCQGCNMKIGAVESVEFEKILKYLHKKV